MTQGSSHPKPNPAVFAEAAEWLIDFREGQVDAEGRRRFTSWLRRSPEHIHAYMEAAALWGDIPKLAEGMQVDIEAVVAHARAQGNVTALTSSSASAAADPAGSTPQRLARVSRFRRPRALAAALVAFALAAALIAWLQEGRATVYTTAIGEQRSIALADGSRIELGARSGVRVEWTKRERAVQLVAGQALFSVAKDPSRPFVVTTENARVLAVGTQFDVNKRTSGTIVTVLEGRVAVLTQRPASALPRVFPSSASASAPGSPPSRDRTAEFSTPTPDFKHRVEGEALDERALYVSAGEQVTVPELTAAQLPRPHPLRAAAGTAWVDQTLSFDNAPLSDVVEEFNRYNEKQIVLTDTELDSLRLSGVFAATKPSSLLIFLAEQMHLGVTDTGDRVSISPPPTKK